METIVALISLYEYYHSLFGGELGENNVEVSKYVSAGVSSCHPKKDWTWRYLLSIKNGTIEPSSVVSLAIQKHYDQIFHKPDKKKKPLPDLRTRTLKIRATESELEKIKQTLSTRERTEKLL